MFQGIAFLNTCPSKISHEPLLPISEARDCLMLKPPPDTKAASSCPQAVKDR